MAINKPSHSGTLTPQIEALVNDFIQELSATGREYTPQEYLDALTCPIAKAPITVITLLGLSFFGEYTHKEEKIQIFIRSNFEGMQGSLHTTIQQLMSAIFMGNSVAEWGIVPKGKQWVLDRIKILTPGRWSFMGAKGEITQIRYYSTQNIDVPYEQCLHIVNNPHMAFDDPRGVSDLDGAIAAIKAWNILMSEMLIAGQRQATKQVVGYYDDDAPDTVIKDVEGNPVLDVQGVERTKTAGEQMSEQLSNIENKTSMVTSIRNKVEALDNEVATNFFEQALNICQKAIFMSFLFPETALQVAAAGGDSNLNRGHMSLLETNVKALVDQIKETMLDKLIRPLIVWNFGDRDDWGSFEVEAGAEEERVALGNLLISAFSNQIFTIDDLEAVNKLREFVGMSKLDKLPEAPQVPPESPPTNTSFSLSTEYWRMFEPNGHAIKK